MEHAGTTKTNDAVTERQFNRFLANAKLPPRWEGKVTCTYLLLIRHRYSH